MKKLFKLMLVLTTIFVLCVFSACSNGADNTDNTADDITNEQTENNDADTDINVDEDIDTENNDENSDEDTNNEEQDNTINDNSGNDSESNSNTNQNESTNTENENNTNSESDNNTNNNELSFGQTLLSDFRGRVTADPAISAQALADALLTNPAIQFAGGSMPVEPGLLTGFDNAEITGFSEGVMFAPAIGSIPFVGYIFILEDGADVNAFMSTLSSNANPRWNICVTADETVVDSVGNTVFFVMCPSSADGE